MRYKFPRVKLNDDGLFGPTSKGHYYKPVSYHNRTAKREKHKSRWILKKNEQYETFKVSDESGWICLKKKGLFSILDNGHVVMGLFEERISFFPNTTNTADAWHGYPINSGECEPSIDLVDKWLEDKIIDARIHLKILKGQI